MCLYVSPHMLHMYGFVASPLHLCSCFILSWFEWNFLSHFAQLILDSSIFKKINQNIFTRMHIILYDENSVIINSLACMLRFHLTIFVEFCNHTKTLCICATIWANPVIMSSTIGNMKVVGRLLLKCLLTCSTSLQIWHVCKCVVYDNQHDRIHDS